MIDVACQITLNIFTHWFFMLSHGKFLITATIISKKANSARYKSEYPDDPDQSMILGVSNELWYCIWKKYQKGLV